MHKLLLFLPLLFILGCSQLQPTNVTTTAVTSTTTTTLTPDSTPKIVNLRMERSALNLNVVSILADSSGLAPTPESAIKVSIPNGNSSTLRSRTAVHLGGTATFTLVDGIAYWNRSPSTTQKYPVYLYAIWDGNGIVWALAQNPSYKNVQTTTTNTAINYFLLEDGSTYIRSTTHYCVCVGQANYLYNTAADPDNIIDPAAFLVAYMPEDYESAHHNQVLATTISGESLSDQAILTQMVLWRGTYLIIANLTYTTTPEAAPSKATLDIRAGANYAGGTVISHTMEELPYGGYRHSLTKTVIYDIDAGNTVYLGASLSNGNSGKCYILGNSDSETVTSTNLEMILLDNKYGIWY